MPIQQWDSRALAVLEALTAAGHQAVFVGGCVRDTLLGLTPHDYDAATSARPEEILAACSRFRCVETGVRHGTITVVSDGLPVEVTTFRREGTYSDHRHPDRVDFTRSLPEDLARRDFTINAMAWDGRQVIDLFGGQADLSNRLIRCVGDPVHRFQEDALRILRGLRLAAQLEFSIQDDTARAIRLLTPLLGEVSRERIGAEFSRLVCAPGGAEILLAFPHAAGQILPELAPSIGFEQYNPHHIYNVYEHSIFAMKFVPNRLPLRLAALLHDVGKPGAFTRDAEGVGHFYGHDKAGVPLAATALDRLRLPKTVRERTLALVALHHLPLGPEERMVRRRLSKLGPELFFDLLDLQRADAAACAPGQEAQEAARVQTQTAAQAILAQGICLSLKTLAVNGHDAQAVGLRGRAVGQALNSLLEQVSEGTIPNERAALLPLLEQISHNLGGTP